MSDLLLRSAGLACCVDVGHQSSEVSGGSGDADLYEPAGLDVERSRTLVYELSQRFVLLMDAWEDVYKRQIYEPLRNTNRREAARACA